MSGTIHALRTYSRDPGAMVCPECHHEERLGMDDCELCGGTGFVTEEYAPYSEFITPVMIAFYRDRRNRRENPS